MISSNDLMNQERAKRLGVTPMPLAYGEVAEFRKSKSASLWALLGVTAGLWALIFLLAR